MMSRTSAVYYTPLLTAFIYLLLVCCSFFSFFLREHFELTLRSLCTGVCIVVKKAPLHKRLFVSDVCKSTALVRFNSSPLAIRFMSLYGGPVGPGPGVSWVSVVLVSPESHHVCPDGWLF